MHELTEIEERKLESNLVWVIASRRSGTSWLSRELLSYNTKFMNEPLVGFHLAGLLGRNAKYYRRIDESQEKKDYFFNNNFKETWIFFLRKLILNRIYAQFQSLDSIIVIKEPNGSMGADIIFEALPNSKMIFLLRDPRDVINSNLTQISKGGFAEKTEKTGGKLTQFLMKGKQRLNEVKFRSQDWLSLIDIINSAFENHNENLRYFLKYEDLRTNTTLELKKLYEFLQISISDEEVQKIVEEYTFENIPEEKKGIGTQRQFGKVGIWKEKFTSEEINLMKEIMAKKLEKFGYEF